MMEMTLSVDVTSALSALQTTAEGSVAPVASVLPQPAPEAVAAFQSALGSLVSENQNLQKQLNEIVAKPMILEGCPVSPLVIAEESITPDVRRQFNETVAPLVADNGKIQGMLEEAVARPLALPTGEGVMFSAPEVPALPTGEGVMFSAPEVPALPTGEVVMFSAPKVPALPTGEVVMFSAPKVPALPTGEGVMFSAPEVPALPAEKVETILAPKMGIAPELLTPEHIQRFIEVLAPLIQANGKVQAALEEAVSAPLMPPVLEGTIPEMKILPEKITPKVAKQFAEAIAPLITENQTLQEGLATVKPLKMAKPVNADEPGLGETDQVVLRAAPLTTEAPVSATVPAAGAQTAVAGIPGVDSVSKVAPTASDVLIAVAEAVAETIMVTPGLLSGEGQVRVQLKPDVLAGTEILLSVAGRTMSVNFLPQTEEMSVLIQRCLPQLEQHLASKIHAFSIAATVTTSRRQKV